MPVSEYKITIINKTSGECLIDNISVNGYGMTDPFMPNPFWKSCYGATTADGEIQGSFDLYVHGTCFHCTFSYEAAKKDPTFSYSPKESDHILLKGRPYHVEGTAYLTIEMYDPPK